ncbi:MAG: hypothetical protein MUF22_02660 [Chitinispirillaceae bacterium]|jgi:hypothetical protein|nr:hypothetical protein [Chitinispirillaceae bacterium]
MIPLTPLAAFAGGIAFCYLDPSTGSMIISAIVGVIAAVALAFKTVWYTITKPFRKKKPAGTPPKQ